MSRMTLAAAVLLLVGGTSAAPMAQLNSPPTAPDFSITAAPGDTVLIGFPVTDPDGDQWFAVPTSGLSNPSAGSLFISCACSGLFSCFCTTAFVADANFAGSVTFTYHAIDFNGNISPDATVTINSTVAAQTPEQILDGIEFVIVRGTQAGGDIDEQLKNPLLARVDGIRANLAAGRFNAALGEAGALCNQIDAGIRTDRIRDQATVLHDECVKLHTGITTLPHGCANDIHDLTWSLVLTDDWKVDLFPNQADEGDFGVTDTTKGTIQGTFEFHDVATELQPGDVDFSDVVMDAFIAIPIRTVKKNGKEGTIELLRVPFAGNAHPHAGAHADHVTTVSHTDAAWKFNIAKLLSQEIQKRRDEEEKKGRTFEVKANPTTELLLVKFIGSITTVCVFGNSPIIDRIGDPDGSGITRGPATVVTPNQPGGFDIKAGSKTAETAEGDEGAKDPDKGTAQ